MAQKKISIRRKAVESNWKAIELTKQRLVAFQWAIAGLEKDRYIKPDVREGIKAIWSALSSKELDAYRSLFMMAIILPDELLEKTKREIIERFIGEGKSIMQYLNIEGELPNSFSGPDRETFRELMLESLREDNDA